MSVFNAKEIVQIGIEKEKKRRDFYAKAADFFADKHMMKELFSRLRDWEVEHVKKFTEIGEQIHDLPSTESYSGELEEYINTLVDDKLYNDVSDVEFTKNVKDPMTAIQFGIGFEKDAILLFVELQKYAEPGSGKVIEQLIKEEKQHIVYLMQLRDKLFKRE